MKSPRALFIAVAPLLLLFALMASVRIISGVDGAGETADPSGQQSDFPAPAPGFPADPATQKALVKVAGGQVNAIKESNWQTALSLSAPAFVARMTPERFAEMIRTEYEPMIRSVSEEYRTATVSGNYARVPVEISVAGGGRYLLNYHLMRMEGTWRVTDCNPPMPVPRSASASANAPEPTGEESPPGGSGVKR